MVVIVLLVLEELRSLGFKRSVRVSLLACVSEIKKHQFKLEICLQYIVLTLDKKHCKQITEFYLIS